MKEEFNSGEKINGLTYLFEVDPHIYPSGKQRRKAKFKCYCGNEFITMIHSIKSGNTNSCGCYYDKTHATHGLAKHPLFAVRNAIKQRCLNPKNTRFHDYGGRGIKICDEWLNDFQKFYDWSIQNGYRKGLQLDRINNDGNYEPSNCRFVTQTINIRNRRISKLSQIDVIEIRNAKLLIPNLTHKELATAYFVSPTTITNIINNKLWGDV